MAKQAIDFTALEAAAQAIGDAQYAQGATDQAATDGVPVSPGITAQQEADDIAAAVSTAVDAAKAEVSAQLATLQADDDAKTAALTAVNAKIDAIKAALA